MDTVLGSTAIWNEEPCHLKDFAKRNLLPCLAMVRRGYYRGIIQPDQVVYVHHLDASQKVLAEALKHPRRRGGGGGRGGGTNYYSLPTTYAGWFELLSEDGKPVQPIRSVEELAKASPHQCIVREAFRAPFTAPGADNFSTERQRLLGVGERLALHEEVDVVFRGSRGGVATKRYLRCSVAGDGDSVYLGFDVRAQFSPIADDEGTANSISGVHSLRGLLERFRLPVVVRLVCGNIPSRVERGFVPVFRLIGAYREESVFLLPVGKEEEEAKLIAVSTREPLYLVGAKNTGVLRENSEFHAMKTKCDASIHSYTTSIQILVDPPDGRAISRGKETTRVDRIKTGEISNPDREEYELLLFEEIEEIYRYVREGGDPPQPKTRPVSTKTEVLTSAQNSTLRPPTTSRLRPSVKETENGEGTTTLAPDSPSATIEAVVNGKAVATPGNDATLDGVVVEEQIYQDIDKIRERKQLEKSSRSKSPPTSKFPLEAKRATTIATAAKESRVITKVTESATDDSKSRIESLESDGMVKSLRQVYLRSQQPSFVKAVPVRDKPQTPSLEDDDDAKSTLSLMSPPVPPKLFEGEAGAGNNSAKILTDLYRSVEAVEAPPPSLRPKSQPPKVPAKSKQRILSSDQTPPPTPPCYPSGPSVDGKPAVAKGGSPQEVIEEPERPSGLTRTRPADVYKAAEAEFSSYAAAPAPNPSLDTVIPPQTRSIFSATAENLLTPGPLSGNLTADIAVSPPMNLNPQNHRPPLDHAIVRSTIPPSVSVKPDSNLDDVSTKHLPSDVTILMHELPNSPTTGKHDSLNTFSVKQEELNPFDRNTGPELLQSIRHEHINPVSTNQNPTSANPEHQLLLEIGSANDQAPNESLPSPADAATGQTESSHHPVIINTNSGSRVNWNPGVGSGPQGGPNSTVQVGNDGVGRLNTATNSKGVTTIRVSGVSNPDPKFFSQGGGAGNTQIYVRFPNSPSGQTLYRPPGSLSGARVQSGTVYLTNGKAGDGDHWA